MKGKGEAYDRRYTWTLVCKWALSSMRSRRGLLCTMVITGVSVCTCLCVYM